MWGWQLPRNEGGPDAPRELAPDLAPVAWRGRAVFIVYDSDLADNPGVAYAEWYAAEALTAKGATVKVVRLPHLPGGAKCGLDDYLVANGPDAFRGLLAAAVPPARPPGAASTADDALPPDEADDDPHRLAQVYRAACRAARQVDGKTTWQDALVYHAEEYLRWSAGAYRPMGDKEVKAELTASIKKEFDHVWRKGEAQRRQTAAARARRSRGGGRRQRQTAAPRPESNRPAGARRGPGARQRMPYPVRRRTARLARRRPAPLAGE